MLLRDFGRARFLAVYVQVAMKDLGQALGVHVAPQLSALGKRDAARFLGNHDDDGVRNFAHADRRPVSRRIWVRRFA